MEKNNLERKEKDLKLAFHKEGGYAVIRHDNPIFELLLKSANICILKGEFFDRKGNLVAKGTNDDLFIFKGPAILGKMGHSLGIVIQK